MTFHRIFGENTHQSQIFEECGVKRLVEKAVEGYNSTVFAYGQTGSGKTHTITGPDDIPFTDFDNELWGVVPRCLRYMFALITRLNETQPDARVSVHASYLEIYNEQVQDLLNPTNVALPVRYNNEKGFFVENLFVVECEVLDDCMAVLEEGLKNRKTASHALNDRSSRSHGIMTMLIQTETVDPDDSRLIRKTGKLSFVDLAGSEKIKESKATGQTLTETLNINKSLLTLGICISALAEMKRKNKNGQIHVPYRDSKLTKLLSDTLGGNGVALMVACVSPAAYNLNETLSTLRYASRAKYIQNRPAVQIDPREELILKLKKQVKETTEENDRLRQLLSEFEQGTRDSGKTVSREVTTQLQAHEKQMLAKLIEENRTLKSKGTDLTQERQKLSRENHDLIDENNNLISKLEKLVQVFGASVDQEIKAAEAANSGVRGFFRGLVGRKQSSTGTGGGQGRLTMLSKKALSADNVTSGTNEDNNPTDLYAKKRLLLNTLDFARRKHIDKSVGGLLFSDDEGLQESGASSMSNSEKNETADVKPKSPKQKMAITIIDGDGSVKSPQAKKKAKDADSVPVQPAAPVRTPSKISK
jgi:kinesin family member 12